MITEEILNEKLHFLYSDILGRHKQDLVKKAEIHHHSSQNHKMIIFWEFQESSSIFEQYIKHKEEDHEPWCIFDLK